MYNQIIKPFLTVEKWLCRLIVILTYNKRHNFAFVKRGNSDLEKLGPWNIRIIYN